MFDLANKVINDANNAGIDTTGITPERLAELVKAYIEYRLVELPVPLGGTVYWACEINDENGRVTGYKPEAETVKGYSLGMCGLRIFDGDNQAIWY